ncbi:MAG: AMP-binding protein [Desulfovibrionaceae bacterium]
MSDNLTAAILGRNSANHPDKAALLFEQRRITHAELELETLRLAAELVRRGVAPGDRVALLMPDSPAMLEWFLAALLAGAIAVPINERVSLTDREFILKDANPVLLVVAAGRDHETNWSGTVLHADLADPAGKAGEGQAFVPHVPATNDPAYMLYTSGSTGKPKGVVHSQGDLFMHEKAFGPAILGDASGDVLFSCSKFPFAYGLGVQAGLAVGLGATLVLHPGPPEASVLLELIRRHAVSVFFAVPTVYQSMLRERTGQEDVSSLRMCYSAGEAMPSPVHEALRAWLGVDVLDGYGSTETSFVVISNMPGRIRPGTLGEAVPGYTIRLEGEDGREAAEGASGRVLVRGPGLSKGYWNRPEATVQNMRADGWLDTGDLCAFENGAYRYLGRADDMIKTGGQWVSPVAVEDCLLTHSAVAECGVARYTMYGFDYPAAFVVAAPGFEAGLELAGELRRHVRALLPKHMSPVKVVFMPELPRTATGKIQRHKLRR